MIEITPGELARREGFDRYVSKLREPSEIAKRFWSKVNKSGQAPAHFPELGPCWLWTGAKGGTLPYGIFNYKGKNWNAHRVAYLLIFGEFDLALDVLHRCDNPPCCNGSHLFLGTAHDNIQDAIQKGRWNCSPRPGESNSNHVLAEKDVREIRALHARGGITQRAIARRFGVAYQTINEIVLKKNWTHI